jgi:ABC-type amino acid transport substrate-binding protein
VKDTTEALQAVSWNKADAYIGTQAVAQWLIQQEQLTNLKFTGDPGIGVAPQNFGIYKDPEWEPLVGILNQLLANVSDDQKRRITQKWLPNSADENNQSLLLKLSVKERQWLKQLPELRLGVDPAWPPFEYVDDQGVYRGLAADFIQLIEQKIDKK